jgi:hypothetical protein
MSAPLLNGASPSRDPFQGARTTATTPILALARQWDDLTRQIDDGAAYAKAQAGNPPHGGDEMVATLWERRDEIERQASALEPSIAGIAFKLRAMLWSMDVEHAECANGNGVRTNEQRGMGRGRLIECIAQSLERFQSASANCRIEPAFV